MTAVFILGSLSKAVIFLLMVSKMIVPNEMKKYVIHSFHPPFAWLQDDLCLHFITAAVKLNILQIQ